MKRRGCWTVLRRRDPGGEVGPFWTGTGWSPLEGDALCLVSYWAARAHAAEAGIADVALDFARDVRRAPGPDLARRVYRGQRLPDDRLRSHPSYLATLIFGEWRTVPEPMKEPRR